VLRGGQTKGGGTFRRWVNDTLLDNEVGQNAERAYRGIAHWRSRGPFWLCTRKSG